MIYLKKLINESSLTEMPLGAADKIGNFDKGASFRDKRDRDIINNPTSLTKVKDFFKNTSADFDFYFVNLRGRRKFAELGNVDEDFIFEPYPKGLGIKPEQLRDGKIKDDAITVFFVGNSAAEKTPMTPWTIAHRFGHSVFKTYGFKVYNDWLNQSFVDILKMYNIANSRIGDNGYQDYEKSKASLFNQIGTMRSARLGKINRPTEFYFELFAQYLKSGEVKFNRLKSTIVKGHGAYGRKEHAYTQQLEYVNDMIDSMERDFTYYAEDVLSSVIGSIFIM